jgi:hypothetical protein
MADIFAMLIIFSGCLRPSLSPHSLLPPGDTSLFSGQWKCVRKVQLVSEATPSTKAVGRGWTVSKASQADSGGILSYLDLRSQLHTLLHVSL